VHEEAHGAAIAAIVLANRGDSVEFRKSMTTASWLRNGKDGPRMLKNISMKCGIH
jgi:hypothetical protein